MTYREIAQPALRRIIECLSYCPTWLAAYVAMHMDTISKLLNHLLCFMLLCDVFVFLASWNVSFLPTASLGLNTVLMAFLLCAQTIFVWLILNSSNNSNRISALSFLAPTEFMVGIAFGITIGAAILAFVLSTTYRGQCKSSYHHAPYRHLYEVMPKDNNNAEADNDDFNDYNRINHQRSYYGHDTTTTTTTKPPSHDTTKTTAPSYTGGQQSINYYDDYPVGNYVCLERRGSVNAIWFWSGLLVWLNFACCLLLAIGRADLAQSISLYEEVGTLSMDDYQDDLRRRNGATASTSASTFPGDLSGVNFTTALSPPSLGGAAYSSVPEIRENGR